MRILILSCNTGEGHNSCAKAIKEAAERRGDQCDIRDALSFVSDGTSRFISSWHVRLYRYFPKINDGAYRYAQEHPGVLKDRNGASRLMKTCLRKMRAFIVEGGYDAVLCAHLIPARLVTTIQRQQPMAVRTGFLATDYTASPGCDQLKLDWFFIPDERVAGEFLSMGIAREKLVDSGIPVRRDFYQRMDRRQAKQAVGIDPDHRHLLVMSGSMGAGHIPALAAALSRAADESCELTVVCGTNRHVKQQLEQKVGQRKNLHILGFVQGISALMDSADLYLTKPGGISTSEAWVKGLPMVLVKAVAGCEEPNLEFFTRMGGAVAAEKPQEAARLCLELLADQERLEAMSQALARGRERDAAEIICRVLAGQ